MRTGVYESEAESLDRSAYAGTRSEAHILIGATNTGKKLIPAAAERKEAGGQLASNPPLETG